MSPPPPPPKPKGLGGFSLPWRGGDDAKGKSKAKPPLIGKFKGLQAGLIDKLKDQATAAITGGVSGVLVLLTIYKVISSRESVLAESRKDQQRVIMERKARLAVMRRSLAGPLRSAARDLNVRLREILLPTPPTGDVRHNYFASHYLEDPDESINTTLYRLCRYLFWVEQLQRGIHSDGELAMDDAWQVAVDVRLERVRQALASSDPLVDATKARERLYDVIDAAVAREREKRRAAAARAKLEEKEKRDNGVEDPQLVVTKPSFKATARALSSTAGTLLAAVPNDATFRNGTDAREAAENRESGAQERVGLAPGLPSFSLTESPDEPGLRVGRFPLRLFRDTQTAIAEVFGEEAGRGKRRGAQDNSHAIKHGAPHAGGGSADASGASVATNMAGLGEMLYTDFVIKLESALLKGGSANEPWARWMVPLHLQYHRYASLQARRQRQLTPAQGREVLAARVRLHRVSQALDELLAVLRRRLDDPWFLHSMKRLRKEALANASDAHSYQDAVKRAATKDVESVAGAGADGKPRKRGVTKRGAFAAFRTARWWARQKALRHEAVERWAMLRDALPEVRALGAAWWDREQPHGPKDAFLGIHFREDSAKAAQVAVALLKWIRARANRVAHVVLDAAAERPVRALAVIAMGGLAGVAKDRKKKGKPLRIPRARRRRASLAAAPEDPGPHKKQVSGDIMRDWMAQKTKEFHTFQTQAPPMPSPRPPPARTKRREGEASSSPPREETPAPPRQPPRNKHPPPAPSPPVPPARSPKQKPDAGAKADAPAPVMAPAPAAAAPAHSASKPTAPVSQPKQTPVSQPKQTPVSQPKQTPAPTPKPTPASAHPAPPAAAEPADTPKSGA